MPRQLVIQMVVNALVAGTVYMLMASGLTLIYGIMHQINMAHGVFFMLGAMLAYFATKAGVPYFASLVLILVAFPLVGMVFERIIFRPIRHLWLAGYMSTIGVWILIEGLGWQFLGTEEKGLVFPIGGAVSIPGGVSIPWSKIVVCLLALLTMVSMWWIVARTSIGRQLRAIEQQPRAAQLVGIDNDRVMALGFALGITLAAFAGGLVSTLYSISPTSGSTPMLKAFIIIILGGLGSVAGSVVAAYLLGFVDSFGGTLAGPQAGHFIGFALVILILIVKPAGILGHE